MWDNGKEMGIWTQEMWNTVVKRVEIWGMWKHSFQDVGNELCIFGLGKWEHFVVSFTNVELWEKWEFCGHQR